jgi:hypothetical protein
MMKNIDLTYLTVGITGLSALVCLIVMQVVTKEAGFKRGTSRWRLCQRCSLATLSVILGYDCYDALTTGADPRFSDLLVHGALLWVLICLVASLLACGHTLPKAKLRPKNKKPSPEREGALRLEMGNE